MRNVAMVMAGALAGCGTGMSYIVDEYRGTEVKSFAVEGEDTYRIFDKPDKNKLMITPSLGASAGIGMAAGLSFHAVDTTPPKPVYERAALGYLTSSGRKCRIIDAYLLVKPQWEIKYDCGLPTAPSMSAPRSLLSQVLQARGTARADYQSLASCVATKLDEPGLTKTDLPPQRTSKVSLTSGGVRYWEAVFKGTGANLTEWSVTAANTIWGAFPSVGKNVAAVIKTCT